MKLYALPQKLIETKAEKAFLHLLYFDEIYGTYYLMYLRFAHNLFLYKI